MPTLLSDGKALAFVLKIKQLKLSGWLEKIGKYTKSAHAKLILKITNINIHISHQTFVLDETC